MLDFGLAAEAGQGSTDADGTICGTPLYLAPEQLRGERSFPPADIFGLGLLLHECLTGTPAWTGTTSEAVLAARHLKPVRSLPGRLGLPADLLRLYERCVAPRPAKRPSARTAAATLRRNTSLPIASRTAHAAVGNPRVARSPALILAAAGFAAVALVIGFLLLTSFLSDANPVSAQPVTPHMAEQTA
ncbi:protein kinase [Actinoplanes sp. NPDC026619]|uniref:protein kinase domain-containing protein n=1 Tax=Actinoplanes sp. NPDC026619 TaxID=3155798 RepID=UPI0033D3C87C